jgi:hypothetical protein
MTTEATGATTLPPEQLESQARVECELGSEYQPQPQPDSTNITIQVDARKPTGLHSPPDSNGAVKFDSSDDSELSDLDDAAGDFDFAPPVTSQPSPPQSDTRNEDGQDQSEGKAEDEEVDDIGVVVPDHWSGTVPVFKPSMHQFKDFKKFVRLPPMPCGQGRM